MVLVADAVVAVVAVVAVAVVAVVVVAVVAVVLAWVETKRIRQIQIQDVVHFPTSE